eukprot:12923652-Prorocentrum_lima.AAC.1
MQWTEFASYPTVLPYIFLRLFDGMNEYLPHGRVEQGDDGEAAETFGLHTMYLRRYALTPVGNPGASAVKISTAVVKQNN